jgi:hypothetical protein
METRRPTLEFDEPAPAGLIDAVAAAMRANGIDVHVVDTGEDARRRVLQLIPEGAEVHSGKSKTLEDIGLAADLHESGRYDSVRARYRRMDRQTQGREIRKLIAAPDFMVGSVHAVTEGGDLVTASASANQLGPYVSGAGRLILVVGSQKIVRDLDEALRRIREHVLPWEDARVREQIGMGSFVAKVVIQSREWPAGRTTVFLVREPLGI